MSDNNFVPYPSFDDQLKNTNEFKEKENMEIETPETKGDKSKSQNNLLLTGNQSQLEKSPSELNNLEENQAGIQHDISQNDTKNLEINKNISIQKEDKNTCNSNNKHFNEIHNNSNKQISTKEEISTENMNSMNNISIKKGGNETKDFKKEEKMKDLSNNQELLLNNNSINNTNISTNKNNVNINDNCSKNEFHKNSSNTNPDNANNNISEKIEDLTNNKLSNLNNNNNKLSNNFNNDSNIHKNNKIESDQKNDYFDNSHNMNNQFNNINKNSLKSNMINDIDNNKNLNNEMSNKVNNNDNKNSMEIDNQNINSNINKNPSFDFNKNNNEINNNNQNQNNIFSNNYHNNMNNNNNDKNNNIYSNHNNQMNISQKHYNNLDNNQNVYKLKDNEKVNQLINNINIDTNDLIKKNKIIDSNNNKNKEAKYSFSRYTKEPMTGLVNLGDTSYLNAILRLIGSIRNIASYFLNPENQKRIYIDIENFRLSFVFCRLFIHLYPFPEKEREIYSPNNLLEALGHLNVAFKSLKKRNPNELIVFILNELHNELNQLKDTKLDNIPNQNLYNKNKVISYEINKFVKTNNSIISNQLNWFEVKESKSTKCYQNTYNFYSFNVFELDISGTYQYKNNNINLIDCLHYHKMEKRQKLFCNKCRKYEEILSKLNIYLTSKTIIFSLNRGDLDKANLINIKFDIQEQLDLTFFIEQKKTPIHYELNGIVSITKNNNNNNNLIYVCFYKSPIDHQWYYFNNENVRRLELKDIIDDHNDKRRFVPCILYYKEFA